MVTLGVLGIVDLRLPLQQVVDMPRFHHQFLPDEIQYEPNALDQDAQQQLLIKGHKLNVMKRVYGNMQAVQWRRGADQKYVLEAASDHRGEGSGQTLFAQ